MRQALWERSPGALATLLNSRAPLHQADLYTLTLAGGAILRWSGADLALSGGGNTWAVGPGISRTRVRFSVGIEVDSLTVTVTDNVGTTINGQRLMAAIAAGLLTGARLQLDRAFWGIGDTDAVGALVWFAGRVADVTADRYGAQLTVKSDLELLDVMVPREVYQPGCLNTLYDQGCGVRKVDVRVQASAWSASDATRTTFAHQLGHVAGHFDLGVITMLSGDNAGVARTVKRFDRTGELGGSLAVLQPWPFPVHVGDSFELLPGCDKTQGTCSGKFKNMIRFRGQPYIPVPETVA